MERSEIVTALKTLFEPGDVFEVRVLGARYANYIREHIESGYFDYDHIDKVPDALAKINSAVGVYVTMNPVNPALLARSANRLQPARAGGTTGDKDIVFRRWMLVDIDPVRPSGISSTDEEKTSALEKATEVRAGLQSMDWPEPIQIDSGNGYYLMYRVDLPTDDNGIVKQCIQALQAADHDTAKIDGAVHNAARICRLPGTPNCKGDSLPERPHRVSKILACPSSPQCVPGAMLDSMASLANTNETPPQGRPCGVPSKGTRPGDEFNRRGEIAPILEAHGWRVAFEAPDGNQHWTRPGKSSGTSATLKQTEDGPRFYVFSCNAAPFESGQAYSPFSVYAHLVHHGDFVAAARQLSSEGYGDNQIQPSARVDISALVGTEESIEPDNELLEVKPISEDLMQVPGFVGDVMDFGLNSAPYPSIPMAFCGAMALQSYLSSRRVREEGGLRPNLYLLALATSGAGKGYPRKINTHILKQLGLGGALGNQISSGQGLEDEMLIHRKMLFQTDEVDNMLGSLSSSKDPNAAMLLAMLLQFFTEADEVHSMRTKARARGQQNDARGEIDQPGLVILGTATPECFFDAMSPKLLTNGLFSRSIIVDAGKRGRRHRSHDVSTMPGHLIDVAKWWRDYNPTDPETGRKPDLSEEHPVPAVVPYTESGYAIIDKLGMDADDQYDAAVDRGDRVRATLWTRVCENATRMALVYACSRDHENPCIDQEVAEWATRFARRLTDRMLYLARSHVAENPFHSECLKVMNKLRSAPKYTMPHSVLLKRMKVNSRDLQMITDTLQQQGDVIRDIVSTKGRSQVVYRLNRGG